VTRDAGGRLCVNAMTAAEVSAAAARIPFRCSKEFGAHSGALTPLGEAFTRAAHVREARL